MCRLVVLCIPSSTQGPLPDTGTMAPCVPSSHSDFFVGSACGAHGLSCAHLCCVWAYLGTRVSVPGGGGVNGPPKLGGGRFGKRAQLTGPLISYHKRKIFLSIKNGQMIFAKYMANDDFSEPPRRADSRNPIFGPVTPVAWGFLSVGFWGAHQFSSFRRGGSSQRALSTPPPPRNESPRFLSSSVCILELLDSVAICWLAWEGAPVSVLQSHPWCFWVDGGMVANIGVGLLQHSFCSCPCC